MPAPNVGDVRSYNGEVRQWTGTGWTLIDSPGPIGPQSLGFTAPPPTPSGRTDKQDFSAFKNFLTGAGSTILPMLVPEAGIPMRIAMAAMGGAAGRGAGHAMEPNPDESLSSDIALGGTEGAGLELGPTALSGALRVGGRALGTVGRKLNIGSGWMRGLVAREAGLPAPAIAAAVAGPPVADVVGRGAERLGDAIGPETTSQRLLRFFRGGSAEPAAGTVERYAPNVGRQSTEVPGFSMPAAADVPEPLPQPSLDRYGANRSGYQGNAVPEAPGSISSLERQATASPVDRFTGQSSGYAPGPVPEAPSSLRGLEEATKAPLEPYGGQSSGYEPGAVPRAPSELTDEERQIIEGTHAFDPDLGMVLPRDVPDFTYEAGHPDIPGLTVDAPPSVDQAPPSLSSLSRATATDMPAAPAAAAATSSGMPEAWQPFSSTVPPADVESALVNMGFKRKEARSVAAQAVDGTDDVGVAVSRALRMLAPAR